MARTSKHTTPFEIYTDTGALTPDSSYNPSFDDVLKEQVEILGKYGLEHKDGFVTESENDDGRDAEEDHHDETDGDDEGRETAFARTSISSLPDSHYPTDHERFTPMHKPYLSRHTRPSVRRPDSFRRSQVISPPPFFARSPRGSGLRGSRSGIGTPKADGSGSPRPRRKAGDDAQEKKQYPLVLLHVTLLPVSLPWSYKSMRELLPEQTLRNVQLLKSKASDVVLQRGILVPHPQDDYELLEERLLEALELQEGRLTKCGHFRSRLSTDSGISTASGGSDSGMGSSVEGLDNDVCSTCNDRLGASRLQMSKHEWSVRVFAANGLMRANTWAAAWSEMERVDVEIMPWISDATRQKLDERKAEESAAEDLRAAEEEERIREIVEEQVFLAHEEAKLKNANQGLQSKKTSSREQADADPIFSRNSPSSPCTPSNGPKPRNTLPRSDLPPIYRSKDIPLSILLRNYIYLLAQDRRKVAVFFLAMVGLFLALRPMAIPAPDPVWKVLGIAELDLPDGPLTDVLLDKLENAVVTEAHLSLDGIHETSVGNSSIHTALTVSKSLPVVTPVDISRAEAANLWSLPRQTLAFDLSRALQATCLVSEG